MKRHLRSLAILVIGIASLPIAGASPPTPAQTEVAYLLEFIGASGCEFFRNGTWYYSKTAEAHLRYKYDALRLRTASAEEFIEKVATKSSLSGETYAAKCGEGPTKSSSQWLLEVLLSYRAEIASDLDRASRVTRDASNSNSFDSTPD